MKKLRIGIIGIGNMGSAHAVCLYNGKINNAELTAICDIDEDRLNAFTKEFSGITVYCDYKEMIASGNIDAVIIATPHKIHTEIAIFAFKNGIDVLSEKPADILYSKVNEACDIASEFKRKYAVMFNQRNNPIYKKIKQMLDSNELGNIKRVNITVTNWYRTQSYYNSSGWRGNWLGEGGGILINQAPHNIDIINMLFGLPSRITAKCVVGKYHNIEVEDDALLILEYDKFNVVFSTSTGEFPGTNRIEIACDNGKLIVENGKIVFYKLKISEPDFCKNSGEEFAKIPFDIITVEPEEIDTGHAGILQNFVNSILFGEELTATGLDGLNEIMVTNAAYLSSWTEKAVKLPLKSKKFEKLLKSKMKSSSYLENNATKRINNNYIDRWQVKW